MTLVEAQAQLATIQAALQTMISGKRVTQLKVGSGQFIREYKYQDISMELLRQLQSETLALIDSLSATPVLPNFANNKTIPLLVNKDYFNVWANRGIY